ncbi:hypothetical protein HDU97_004092 [Phlyctochytrium planicorne]|nr:hypothetical protein HDU97_004092 [Phlyctochytrium planicorne]
MAFDRTGAGIWWTLAAGIIVVGLLGLYIRKRYLQKKRSKADTARRNEVVEIMLRNALPVYEEQEIEMNPIPNRQALPPYEDSTNESAAGDDQPEAPQQPSSQEQDNAPSFAVPIYAVPAPDSLPISASVEEQIPPERVEPAPYPASLPEPTEEENPPSPTSE